MRNGADSSLISAADGSSLLNAKCTHTPVPIIPSISSVKSKKREKMHKFVLPKHRQNKIGIIRTTTITTAAPPTVEANKATSEAADPTPTVEAQDAITSPVTRMPTAHSANALATTMKCALTRQETAMPIAIIANAKGIPLRIVGANARTTIQTTLTIMEATNNRAAPTFNNLLLWPAIELSKFTTPNRHRTMSILGSTIRAVQRA